MKKLLLSTALLAGGLLGLEPSSFAHGGQYRGPGDTVPPGGGGGGGGGGPASAGPAGPAAPAPSAPGRPGAARPGAPGSPTARRGATAQEASGADLTLWSFWWEFNREPYLDLKSAIQSTGPTRDSEGWFLGKGGQTEGKDSLRPTDQQIHEKVVPALIAALEKETNNDIVTGCLIALAKIGDRKTESGESRFEKIIAKELSNSVQEIAETAAVALGILANETSVPTLASLLKDDADGRKLVGGGEVNYRTRAFAAYGLALIGARTGDEAVRREIVGHLHKVLEADEAKSFDLGTACVIALGLVPLETIEAPEASRESKEENKEKGSQSSPSSSRTAQIDYLLGYLANADKNYLIRAHVPTAVARLLNPPAESAARLPDELHATYKERFTEDLLARLKGGERNEVLESCVLALGMVGDADSDKVDAKIRSALAAVPNDIADQQARNFAMVAMAKVGGNPGSGDAQAGLEEVSKFLLEHISRGKSSIQPWAGLAIGVLCNDMRKNGVDSPLTIGLKEALRTTLREEKDDQKIGSYAVGVGISADQESKAILHEKLASLSSDEPRGYVAVALGLMGDRDAIAPIQKIVSESKYRPELLKQAAIGLGLLGDKELVIELVTMLNDATGLATQAAIASALGRIGDHRSIDPLVTMLQNKELTAPARGFAAVALGIVADKESLPWNSKIGVDLNYRASTTTLNDQNGTGILNIL